MSSPSTPTRLTGPASWGATQVIGAGGTARTLRRSAGALLVEPEFGAGYLLGGMDLAFECTGGATGLDTALRSLRAGGTVIASGMPSGGVDLTPAVVPRAAPGRGGTRARSTTPNSAMHHSYDRMADVIGGHVPVFTIETTLNNEPFPPRLGVPPTR